MCITHTDEHYYILLSSTVRIQIHVSTPIYGPSSGWDLTYRSVIQDVGGVWVGGGNEISLFHPRADKSGFSLVVYVHCQVGYHSYLEGVIPLCGKIIYLL